MPKDVLAPRTFVQLLASLDALTVMSYSQLAPYFEDILQEKILTILIKYNTDKIMN